MKGKINVKTIIVLVVLILVGVLSVFGVKTAKTYLSGAASGSEPKNVIAIPSPDGKSATVTWVSDKASMGVVEYGTTPASLLLRAIETDATVDHKVSLNPLKSGVNYYFRIRVGEDVFDNNGIPYSFKTNAEVVIEQPVLITPTLVPTMTGTGPVVPATCDRATDYNKDGVVNSLDYLYCQKNGTGSPVISGQCQPGVDYNKDGTINSLDIIKCRQGSP